MSGDDCLAQSRRIIPIREATVFFFFRVGVRVWAVYQKRLICYDLRIIFNQAAYHFLIII